jgi:uncharacterized membrane protein YjfL (UPF0719 family)
MTDRKSKRLVSLLATGLFLLVTLAFLIPSIVIFSNLVGEKDPEKRHEAKIALAICSVASLIGIVGFIQWARVATGRVKMRWSWDDEENTSVND